ncbi:SsgA family sporulation/cell division regulator [Streptomyces sp. NPDC015220]|uniref:SsgA family sporulation/cell division regulator n=1 Tax=Streptomyces sp. NPDC015220 TaxID=3364947 RepID=UPI0036F995E3
MNDQKPDFDRESPDEGCRSVFHTTLRRLFTTLAPNSLACRFRYSAADPFAVGIDLVLPSGVTVTWVVARDLLAAGTRRPSGEGDFRAWPSGVREEAGRSLYFSLDRPEGHVTFEADLAGVRQWLDATYELVPAGSECELLDWDVLEAALLGMD